MTRKKQIAAGVALVAVTLMGASSAAMAATSGSISLTANAGVSFVGTYYFYPAGNNHGGYDTYGNLTDKVVDTHAVYVVSKVDGYPWGSRHYNTKDVLTPQYKDFTNWGDALYVSQGDTSACNDLGAILGSRCQETGFVQR